ncbi:hypothetical protein MBLNU457_g0041t1 [Dothideomycetes sp. NU457]
MNRDQDISPPPSKRRRLAPESSATESDKRQSIPSTSSTATKDLTVYSWNINGITPFIQKRLDSFFTKANHAKPAKSTASLRDFLRRHEWPTCLFLQEVKINPDDTATQRAVERAVRDDTKGAEPDYRALFCLPRDKYNARGFGRKVYGVCSIVRTDFLAQTNAKVRTVDWDLEGRIQIVETEAVNGWPKLSIWNIYAVNGTDNPYKDPDTGAVVGTRHDRKLEVHRLIMEESKRLEAVGYSVVLAGDLNIARARIDGYPNLRTKPEQHVRNRADFNKKFFYDSEGFGGIDTFRHLHPSEKRYTYFPRGGPFGYSCDRVDLIVCSNEMKQNITSAGMLDTPAERGPSDHVPLFAKFALESRRTAPSMEDERPSA